MHALKFNRRHLVSKMLFLGMIALAAAISYSTPFRAHAGGPGQINAFFLSGIPVNYADCERFFTALKEGGANSVILAPPDDGRMVDKAAIPNAVYLAHQAGLRIFFVVPVRKVDALLNEHSNWEDMQFDLGSGTIQPTGRLDLFNPEVAGHLIKEVRDIASYSVDGILLGEDFFYSDTEGMSAFALNAHKQKYGSAFSSGSAFGRVGRDDDDNLAVVEGGEGFNEWTELKKSRLMELLTNMITEGKAVAPSVQFGVPLHITGLFTTPKEILRRFAYDMEAFEKLNIGFYWISIPHRDMRTAQGLTYKKTLETLSRLVMATSGSVKDPGKIIIAVQTMSSSGKILPLSEIEEVSTIVKKAGEPGIAYMLGAQVLPSELSRKLFQRQNGAL